MPVITNAIARPGGSFVAWRGCGLVFALMGLVWVVPGLGQSIRPGMGSMPYADENGTGVTFRVWAPNAVSVSVPGEFNGWNTGANPLVHEGGGIWSTDVAAASPGDEYKYHINGSVWKKDPRARQSTYSGSGPGANNIIYDRNAFDWMGDTRLGVFGSDLVIYELHVGALYDPTANGKTGTFADAISKLDHIAGLGVNAVQLLPVMEFSGDYSWGYNLAEPYSVENIGYGGPDGLKSFVKAAHDRGLHVFLDVVHNHYGPDDLDLWGFDNGTSPGVYFYSGAGICCTPWGQRPNYGSQGVRSFIIDSFKMWTDEYHIDGFRWDSVGSMREYDSGSGYVGIPDGDSLIQYINSTTLHAERPGVYSIAEDAAFGMGFDGEWDRGFGDNLIAEVTKVNDGDRDMNMLYYGGGGKSGISGSGHFRVAYCESHDLVGDLNGPGNQRLPKRIDTGDPDSYFARKRSMLAAAVVLSMPAVPMLFMGQEMLEDEQFSDGNPLDWGHTSAYPGVVNFFHDMVHLRRDLDGVSLGLKGPSITPHVVRNDAPWKLLAFHRWGAGADDQVMVIMNFTVNNIPNYGFSGWPADGDWYVNLNSDWTRYGSDFGNQGSSLVNVSGGWGEVAVGPYSVLVLSRQAHPELDADLDGLLNGFEETYFGTPTAGVATADDDLDGASSLEEQTADTHPLQGGSVLKMLSVSLDGGQMTLTWQGGVNARQVVQKAGVLGGVWTDLHTNAPPTAVTNSLTMAAPDEACYFRVSAGPAD